MVECRTPEREVRGSRPTAAVLCPWARHFTPRKYWLITQEAMAPSRYDWKIVDWDVKPQYNQPTFISIFCISESNFSFVVSYPLSAQRSLWSDWTDAQADLSLCWAHVSFCWFCHAEAQMFPVKTTPSFHGGLQQITIKILNIRTPQTFAVITLKFEQDGFTKELCTQKMQPELQTV